MAWNREQIDQVALSSAGADYAAFERIGLSEMEGARVLDVGCFDGFNTLLKFAPYQGVRQVVGIDPSGEAIALACAATSDERFLWRQCSFEDFDPDDDLFDMVYLAHTFQHLPDKAAAAAKAFACLKPGGFVVIKTVDDSLKASWPDPDGIMRQVMAFYEDRVRATKPHTRHTDRNNGAKCYGLLCDAGFEGVSIDVRHATTAGLGRDERLAFFERMTYFRKPSPEDAEAVQRMGELLAQWRELFLQDGYFFDSPTFMVVGRKPGAAGTSGDASCALRDEALVERDGFTLAPMTEADLGQVMRIEVRSFPDPWAPVAYAMELRHNHDASYWVARDASGAVCGYVGWWEAPDAATIAQVAVDPALRRQGVGKLLVEHACSRAAAHGKPAMRLCVRAANATARAFYVTLGFAEAGMAQGYYTNPADDGVLMTKPLSASAAPADGEPGPSSPAKGA